MHGWSADGYLSKLYKLVTAICSNTVLFFIDVLSKHFNYKQKISIRNGLLIDPPCLKHQSLGCSTLQRSQARGLWKIRTSCALGREFMPLWWRYLYRNSSTTSMLFRDFILFICTIIEIFCGPNFSIFRFCRPHCYCLPPICPPIFPMRFLYIFLIRGKNS